MKEVKVWTLVEQKCCEHFFLSIFNFMKKLGTNPCQACGQSIVVTHTGLHKKNPGEHSSALKCMVLKTLFLTYFREGGWG